MAKSPLFEFNEDREHVVSEVCRRAYSDMLAQSRRDPESGIEYILNDAAYQEVERLQSETGPEEEVRSMSWWIDVSKRAGEMSETEKRDILRDLMRTYADDIAGNFDPRVYRFATGVLPFGLGLLFKAQDVRDLPVNMLRLHKVFNSLRDMTERIVVEGHLDTLRHLANRGTLVVVPTHSSNMDSILMGWSLYQSGLPPVTYGAGKNLFTNPLTSYFMNNLGAYKVDRRIQHALYKRMLKTYSQVVIERGYHSLFFPGGTRSRSNMVESHLKLGLLGTAIEAYINNLMHHGQEKPIYVCPVTINYNLVLEAESLIRDHLRREGGRRYFLENDQFDQITQIIKFALNTMEMSSTTVIRYGRPMDCFGNRVERDGNSYDRQGRRVDPTAYVRSALTGEVGHDVARDRQYTRQTGERISEAFLENTVLMPVNIVAFALFELLQRRFSDWDVYRLLRMASGEVIPWHEIEPVVAELISTLEKMEANGDLVLSDFVHDNNSDAVIEEGVSYLRRYHMPEVVEKLMNGVALNKLDLLYYYGNRVRSFDGALDMTAICDKAA
ncbi:MAG: 1-acyl-sn-glycerol-3-phosphate acyltransferase [Myxococcota bacterium]